MKPRHVAVIMDGNGRWAKMRGLPRLAGHRVGIESVRDVVAASLDYGVEYLTLYAFSTENWKRPTFEVEALMSMFSMLLESETKKLHAQGASIRAIGRLSDLPDALGASLARAVEMTAKNDRLTLVLAISYSGRAEIVDACRRLIAEGKSPDEVDESAISEHLYAPDIPEPDLLIRTSSELRLSNFMMWQAAYSELYFTDTLWPDFRREEFTRAIEEFEQRERRFGAL